ncbi:hypothetical protein [Sphingomonas sanxanigenens]|uniref:hypothetical protein n=1 Tax=Sphingomonas sanxanigenens TaxID=397260 RepID=UPI001301576B|nr:hypothetical protein [Sphingomonas sanxanigenens]
MQRLNGTVSIHGADARDRDRGKRPPKDPRERYRRVACVFPGFVMGGSKGAFPVLPFVPKPASAIVRRTAPGQALQHKCHQPRLAAKGRQAGESIR